MTLLSFQYKFIMLIFPLKYFTIKSTDLLYSKMSLSLIVIFNGTLPLEIPTTFPLGIYVDLRYSSGTVDHAAWSG